MADKKEVIPGQRFGMWTVIKEAESRTLLCGSVSRRVLCKCSCGTERSVDYININNGRSNSCGCTLTKHSGRKDTLYTNWIGMRRRSKERTLLGERCLVCDEWQDYAVFKEWSYSSGYKKGLHLCRNGDKGDYQPDNARWDTGCNNSIEKHAHYWEVKDPSGCISIIYNLKNFCRDNNLQQGGMWNVSSGISTHHKGWKCKNLGKDAPVLTSGKIYE